MTRSLGWVAFIRPAVSVRDCVSGNGFIMDYFSTHWWFRQRTVHSCSIGKTLQLGKFPQLSSQTHIRSLKDLQPDLWCRHLTTSCIKCVHIMQLKTSFLKKLPLDEINSNSGDEGFPLLLRPATRGPVEHFVVLFMQNLSLYVECSHLYIAKSNYRN